MGAVGILGVIWRKATWRLKKTLPRVGIPRGAIGILTWCRLEASYFEAGEACGNSCHGK